MASLFMFLKVAPPKNHDIDEFVDEPVNLINSGNPLELKKVIQQIMSQQETHQQEFKLLINYYKKNNQSDIAENLIVRNNFAAKNLIKLQDIYSNYSTTPKKKLLISQVKKIIKSDLAYKKDFLLQFNKIKNQIENEKDNIQSK